MLLFSIIIPHYNSPHLLERLLCSIPTDSQLQIIVIDDKSTCDISAVRQLVLSRGGLFLDNTTERKGAGVCRNLGLAQAKGKWLIFADADDFFLDGAFDILRRHADSDADIIHFIPTSKDMRTGAISTRHTWSEKLVRRYLAEPTKENELMLRYRYMVPWSKMFRNQMVSDAGVQFDEVMAANDIMFSSRCGYSAKSIEASADRIYCVTKSEGTLTTRHDESLYWTRAIVHKNRYHFLAEHIDMKRFGYVAPMGILILNNAARQGYSLKLLFKIFFYFKREKVSIIDMANIRYILGHAIKERSFIDMHYCKHALYELKTLGIREVFWHIVLYLTKSKYAKMQMAVLSEKYLSSMSAEEWEEKLKSTFKCRTGEVLDFRAPQTFNEKIQWLKLYDNQPVKATLADKYRVRKWVQEEIGEEYLIPLLGVWDSPKDVDFDALPEQFAIKANHGSDMILVVRDKSALDIKKTRKLMSQWMKMPFGLLNAEQHYHAIPRKIIAEEYIEQDDGNLYDYKIHCFNGKPEFIQVVGDRDWKSHSAKTLFYDTDWKLTPYAYGRPRYENEKPRPAQLEQLLAIAEKLCRRFIYVRVDLYLLDNGDIKFDEMTFHPLSGFGKWFPPEANLLMGQKIHLPISGTD